MNQEMKEQQKAMIALAVNGNGPGKCWCLGCDKKHANTSDHMGVWINDEKLICTYWMCPTCARNMNKGTRAEQLKLAHEIEDEIVTRYPEVLKHLPENWRDERFTK